MGSCNNKEQIVQVIGDTFSKTFVITNDKIENIEDYIDKVYFVCSDLNIVEELNPIGGNLWELKISSNITSEFPVLVTTYDIIIHYVDGTHERGILEASLTTVDSSNKM